MTSSIQSTKSRQYYLVLQVSGSLETWDRSLFGAQRGTAGASPRRRLLCWPCKKGTSQERVSLLNRPTVSHFLKFHPARTSPLYVMGERKQEVNKEKLFCIKFLHCQFWKLKFRVLKLRNRTYITLLPGWKYDVYNHECSCSFQWAFWKVDIPRTCRKHLCLVWKPKAVFIFEKKPKMGTYLSNRLFLKTRLLHTLKSYVLIVNSS